jgi:hypothetical protein
MCPLQFVQQEFPALGEDVPAASPMVWINYWQFFEDTASISSHDRHNVAVSAAAGQTG